MTEASHRNSGSVLFIYVCISNPSVYKNLRNFDFLRIFFEIRINRLVRKESGRYSTRSEIQPCRARLSLNPSKPFLFLLSLRFALQVVSPPPLHLLNSTTTTSNPI